MSNLALVTDNMLPVANETFIDNLSAGISAGAAIVPINSLSEYSDGDSVVLTVDPGTASQATFIGEKQGNTVIDCKWTEGNVGASHAAGATVIDYDSATHYNVVTKLLRMFANENGSLKTTAVQAALNISSAVPADWTPLANIPTITANNGNKEHILTFTNVDYTDRLQPGTKLRIPRSVAPGTQSIKAVAASSQYASKTAPTGMTFTTQFTVEAIVNFDGYTSTDQTIVGRYNGSTGFILHIDPNGRVVITGIGRDGRSIRSVPIGVDTHIAGSIDMATGATKIYIDGVDVPLVTTGTGTSITQAGDLQIGRYNTTGYLNGSVSNVRIWSTIRTPAQIRDNAHVKLVGNEAGLVFATKDDGTFNDLTANANNLTPSNGIIATNNAFPFKAIEYGIITKVTKPGADTLVTVFSGRNFIPQQILPAVSYSSVDNPFGFPRNKGRWNTEAWFNATLPGKAGGTTAGVWYGNADHASVVNTGEWRLFWESPVYSTNSGSALSQAMNSLSTSLTAETNKRLSTTINERSNASSSAMATPAHAEDTTINQAAQTLWYPTVSAPTSTDGTKAIFFDNSYSVLRIVAECAYL